MFAATAAAEPPDDPPGTLFKFHGFFVFLKAECSVELPIANSSIFSFPKFIKFSACKFSTTVALYGEIKFSSILDAQVVFKPFTFMLSFIPIGIPAKEFSGISPFFLFSSISFASFIASSSTFVKNACTSTSFSSIFFIYAFTISSLVSSLLFSFSCSSWTVKSVIFIRYPPLNFLFLLVYYFWYSVHVLVFIWGIFK